MGLSFGYNKGLPEGVRAAWGARLIVSQDGFTDFVHDRQDMFGSADDKNALIEFLRDHLDTARETAEVLLRSYEMSTRHEKEFVLYEDERGKIVGNTNASAGYLYVAAYLFEHERTFKVAGHTRVDADGTERYVKPYVKRLT